MRIASIVPALLAMSGLLPACSGPGASGTAAGETGAAVEPPATASGGTGAAGSATGASAAAAAPGARCLPVVSQECGCVWECAAGVPEAGASTGDRWTVRPAFWPGTTLRARIDRWCVGDACTDAFFIELDACDGKCTARAADATCRFEGERCLGSAR